MTAKQNRTLLIVILLLAVVSAFVTFSPKIRTYYGLDIQGGVRVVMGAQTEEYTKRTKKNWDSDNLEAVRKVLENRVNRYGVAEPLLITKPPRQIVIELPGLKDEKEAIEQFKSTASLEFYLLPQLGSKDGSLQRTWGIQEVENKTTGGKEEVLVDLATNQPLTPEQLQVAIFDRDPILTGKDLEADKCRAVPQPGTGQPVIEFEFNADGSRIFEETTRANIGKHLAIFLDKKLLTAPNINSVITGRGIIEGNFTLASAKQLADLLNAGALPVPLVLEETRKLEATLGREAVAATTKAGAVGLALVLVFMLAYYRLPGALANVALVLYTLFSFALFKAWPITLTLPGIAGFILSIGMAVDANILIFERLKEELRSGKTLRASIDNGFKRAFTAILDSNVCTIITCFVLYNLGTGPIRGFALTLGLGVAVSMFTAITVTRTFLFALVGMGFATNPNAYGLGRQWHPTLNVMKRKWMWLGLSFAIIIPGLIAWATGGIKPSIDFRGGTELVLPFQARHSADEIQKALIALKPEYKDSRVVVAGSQSGANSSDAYVTLNTGRTPPYLTDADREQAIQALTTKVGALAPGKNVSYSNVGGTVSRELTFNAIEAVIVASTLIVLYLAFRFSIGGFKEGLKYGLCAVAALLHDVAVLWGAFAILGHLLQWQIDSLFVTAMLTVIGFSVHDTIVIFDRIRENLQHRQKGETFSDLTDRSIDQTIARSINTSLTVVLTLLALFLFGGGAVHQFTGALLIGIVSGTYSSIFNASVLLVLWKLKDQLSGVGSATGAKSGLTARPAAPQPGDRPLVKPPSTASSDGSSTSGSASAEGKEDKPRPTPRRQPVRRRRM